MLYIIALAVVLIVCLITFYVVNGKTKSIRNRRVLVFYLLFAIFLAGEGAIGFLPGIYHSMTGFLLVQIVALGFGTLMWFLIKKGFWGEFVKPPLSMALFAGTNVLGGMIGFIFLFNYASDLESGATYSLLLLPFVLPQFISICFRSFQSIPQDIHKVWYYPLNSDAVDFESIDTSNLMMLELVYSKSPEDGRLTNTKLRAPVGMQFGDWFKSFIENYNDKYESDPIHFMADEYSPIGWIFYVKPGFLGSPRYIDPEVSIVQNNITEKRPIIARRVKETMDEEV